ncbi:MAG: hypothetical protein H0V89_14360 [Deltaproteobacteria bacterium]|nr:hypothetical protein [Deltaproteobacteria bacterium]
MSVHEDLSRLLEGELDAAAEGDLRARIAADPALRADWERLQHLPFAALLAAEPPAALDARILASRRPPRRWTRAIPWLIAAGALLTLGVRRPPPLVAERGEAIRIDVGESAEVVLQPPGGDPMTKKTWLAGAGAAVTVLVLKGTATVSAVEPEPTPASAAEPPPRALTAPEVPTAGSSARVAELERENTLLRKLNSDLEIELKGTPVAWPPGLPDALLPPSFEENIRAAVARCAPEVQIVAIDCSEPPCLAGLRVPAGPQDRNWHQALVNECPLWTEPYTNAVATASGEAECADGTTQRYTVLGWSTHLAPDAFPKSEQENRSKRFHARLEEIRLGWPCE